MASRTKVISYWVGVVLLTVLTSLLVVTVLDSMTSRQDADKQLSQSRTSATRRIDLLTKQIDELQARNTELERANATCGGRSL